ncbi:hypothetical protein ACQ4LE_009035 [Meloidogyne hapla]|uniref:Galectin n=1 Tax=Meloidogyne hapla TaxID=6305 RepID=A0A1I8BPW1_MELHA
MLPPSFTSPPLCLPSTATSLLSTTTKNITNSVVTAAILSYETPNSAIQSPLLPPSPLQQQSPISPYFLAANDFPDDYKFLQQINVEIKCFCHIELLNAQFSITHNEETNDFFVELLPTTEGKFAVPILCALFRFLPTEPEHFQIFSSSYGYWRRCGSVQRCVPMPATFFGESEAENIQPLRLHLHVYEQFFSIEMNGKEIERQKHRKEFLRRHYMPQISYNIFFKDEEIT